MLLTTVACSSTHWHNTLMHSQAHSVTAQLENNKTFEPAAFTEVIQSQDSELQDFLEVQALQGSNDAEALLVGCSISAPVLVQGMYYKVDKGKVCIGKIPCYVHFLFASSTSGNSLSVQVVSSVLLQMTWQLWS